MGLPPWGRGGTRISSLRNFRGPPGRGAGGVGRFLDTTLEQVFDGLMPEPEIYERVFAERVFG